VISVTPTTDIPEVIELIEDSGIKRVPVVEGGKLVGILSRRDILHAMGRATAKRRVKVSDLALRERLQTKLNAQPWSAGLIINFIVEKGRVELFGLVESPDQRDAIRVLAENTPDVRSVKDLVGVSTRTLAYT
jgi:CBS domain-containing protein